MIDLIKNADDMVGRTITGVRRLTEAEIEDMDWYAKPFETVVLQLDDGTLVWPQRDPEGNGPGVLTTCQGPLFTYKENF